MNGAYKHLDSPLRIGDLTVIQWIGVLAGVAAGIGWGLYVSPFGLTLTLSTAIYLAALPAGAAAAGSATDLDPWLIGRSAVAWRRTGARFVPGAGQTSRGYVIDMDKSSTLATGRHQLAELTIQDLWEEKR